MTRVPRTGNVQVLFGGLMIGRLKDHIYELGILPDDEHEIKICCEILGPGGHPRQPVPFPDGGVWDLGIANVRPPDPAADVEPFDICPSIDRLSPPSIGQNARMCFDWVLDLEDGHDFPAHPRTMPLIPGTLRPLVRIRNGVLYSNELTPASLHQQLNGGLTARFGKASDQLGVDLTVTPGQQIALVNTTSPSTDILRITVQTGNIVFIWITNHPIHDHNDRRSHFFKYYQAFEPLPPEQKYDFWDLTSPLVPANADDASMSPSLNEKEHYRSGERESGKHEPKSGAATSDLAALFEVQDCDRRSGNPGPLCGTATMSRYSGPM